ncbi:MAG: hypothetical protein F4Z31_02275 [Gemmatimonadetes bacterium]|nr:hypothetical protein [Gemmatimonadota bacterium]
MATSPQAFHWEAFDAQTERAVISLKSAGNKHRGALLLNVTVPPCMTDPPTIVDADEDDWTWSTVHVTVDPELHNNVARGFADTRDRARRLAERAAELRLDELHDQGIFGAPARD